MLYKKSSSRFIFYILTIFFLLLTFTVFTTIAIDNELQELIAINEQGEEEQDQEHQEGQQTEAEVLSKAQRIILELNTNNAKIILQ